MERNYDRRRRNRGGAVSEDNVISRTVARLPLAIKKPLRLIDVSLWASVNRDRVPDHAVYFGHSPGDDLLCSVVLHELRIRQTGPIWMVTHHPELFAHSPDLDRVAPGGARLERIARFGARSFHYLEYARYSVEEDRSVPPKRHILSLLCKQAGLKGKIALRPYIYLTEREKQAGKWANGCVVVQSSALGGRLPMLNKDWYPDRFQKVVEGVVLEAPVIQLGAADDPPLRGAMDLRGRTSLRQSAAILSNAQLYIGAVGFLMHLARAVDCPAVIVYGGREAPWQTGYPCNSNVFSNEPCAPCWRWNRCDFDRRCMKWIFPDQVLEAASIKLREERDPLAVAYDVI